jgi:hypothetical protein
MDLLKELPEWFNKVYDLIKNENLIKSIESYKTFSKLIQNNEITLPTLEFLIEKGIIKNNEKVTQIIMNGEFH